MKKACFCLAALLAGCSGPDRETTPEPQQTALKSSAEVVVEPSQPKARPVVEYPIMLAADGLLAVNRNGERKLVPFGTARGEAESAVELTMGLPRHAGSSSECGAGTVDYSDFRKGLQMTFQDNKFVGWTINAAPSPYKTAKGIGVGSTRQELDAAYKDLTVEDSSLGLLFSSGQLTGLLDQDGIEGLVTDIWAGTVCLID